MVAAKQNPASVDPPESADLLDLRASGLRVTAPRLAVLGAVREGGHPAVEEIAARARLRLGALPTQTVYEVLYALSEVGLLHRIEPSGSPVRFESRVGDNHHHLICRACGAMNDVECTVGRAPCLETSAPSGYAIDEAEVTFWGLCPTCRAA